MCGINVDRSAKLYTQPITGQFLKPSQQPCPCRACSYFPPEAIVPQTWQRDTLLQPEPSSRPGLGPWDSPQWAHPLGWRAHRCATPAGLDQWLRLQPLHCRGSGMCWMELGGGARTHYRSGLGILVPNSSPSKPACSTKKTAAA